MTKKDESEKKPEQELSDEALESVAGGVAPGGCIPDLGPPIELPPYPVDVE